MSRFFYEIWFLLCGGINYCFFLLVLIKKFISYLFCTIFKIDKNKV